jgi:hypothetical protein
VRLATSANHQEINRRELSDSAAQNLAGQGKPMLLWRLSFSHLQRSPDSMLAVKLRFLKEARRQQAFFQAGILGERHECVRIKPPP